MVKSHAWTFNFGDNRPHRVRNLVPNSVNRPTLEPVFGVEGRSTTILNLRERVLLNLNENKSNSQKNVRSQFKSIFKLLWQEISTEFKEYVFHDERRTI